MISPNCKLMQKNGRKETLFERCGADRALYLSCKAVIERRLAPFSVGNPHNGGLLQVEHREAADYVRKYEEMQKAQAPKRNVFSKFFLEYGKAYEDYLGDRGDQNGV